MDIQEKITAYREKDAALQKEARQLKTEFEIYLQDKSISLLERWNSFVRAHADLKNHKTSLLNAKSEALQHIMEHWFDASEVYGRGKIIEVAPLMRDFVDKKGFYPMNLYYEITDNEDEEEQNLVQGQKLLEEMLEEILEKNIGSFTFDW